MQGQGTAKPQQPQPTGAVVVSAQSSTAPIGNTHRQYPCEQGKGVHACLV